MRRVVISGLGTLSPHGLGTAAFWEALLAGKSSITALTSFDASAFSSRVAGTIPPFKTNDYVPKSYRKATRIMARDIVLAVVAAEMSVRDAHLATKSVLETGPAETVGGWFKPSGPRVGCNIGAGLICADLEEIGGAMVTARNEDNTLNLGKWGRSEDVTLTSGMENLTPLWLLKYLPNMLACHVSILHDTQGPSNTITCGQASAGLALGEAMRTIQRDGADLALVGGCESKVNPMALMRWSLLGRLSEKNNETPGAACRPYTTDATGAVLAEGGAVLTIEELEHARKRGATIYAEVIGLGSSSSASHSVVEPDASGEAPGMAIRKALKDAQISPEQIGLIIAPGHAIPEWDAADVKALVFAFGPALGKIPVLAARAGIGDCGAGSQALDMVAAAMSLHTGKIPPSIHGEKPLAGIQLSRGDNAAAEYVLVLATALGGQNSAVVLQRYA